MKNNSIVMRATTLFPSKLAAIAVVPVLAFTIALISGAFTQHASAQTPSTSKPFAVGGFTTLTEHVAFAAQQNPKTTDPTAATGHVVQELATGTNSGKVTCFQPMGNMATITFYANRGPDAGNFVSFMVVDNGEPSAVNTSMDMYTDYGSQGPQTNCNTNCSNSCAAQMVLRGNIVVSSQGFW